MTSYDTYLAQKTEEYLTPCNHYNDEIGIVEHCKGCESYCEEYLETLDYEDIYLMFSEQMEYIQTGDKDRRNFIALNNDLARRHKAVA